MKIYRDRDHDRPEPVRRAVAFANRAIVAHVDGWLTARGWIARGISPEGDRVIPEMGFLGDSPPGVRHYTRSGDHRGDECRVAVAVWPIRFGGRVLGYHVVVATVRASFVRRLQRSLD